MKKISKKIVSVVTMAAFATTLVPTAIFAAPQPVETENVDLTQSVAKEVNVKFDKDAYDVTIQVTKDGKPVNLDIVDSGDASAGQTNKALDYNSSDDVKSGYAFDVEFDKSGSYSIDVVGANAEGGTQASLLGGAKTFYVSDKVSVGNSQLLVDGSANAVSEPAGTKIDVEFDLKDAGTNHSDLALNENDKVYVWTEDGENNLVKDAITFDGLELTDPESDGTWVTSEKIYDENKFNATLNYAGDFVICAGVGDNWADAKDNRVDGGLEVTVTPAEVKTNVLTFGASETSEIDITNNGTVWNYNISDEVTPSDTKVYTVKGVAYTDAAKKNPAANEILSVNADKGLNLGGLETIDEYSNVVKTNDKGEFEFTFTMEDAGIYEISVSEVNGDASATVLVKQGNVDAATIDVVEDGGYVLAGNDTKYASQVYGHGDVYMSDAVQFAITDVYGRDAVGAGVLADEWAAHQGEKHNDAVRVSAPEGSDLKAEDIELAWDENAGVYTLAYVGDNAAKDLIPGEYSVRVALRSGGNNAVTVKFTVAKFGEVQDIVLDMVAGDKAPWDDSANNNAITAIDDSVALGQYVSVTPKYVDENGLKVAIKNYSKLQVGINGDAVANRVLTNGTIGFVTPANTAANNDYVGSIITVKVNDPATNKYIEKELTVVKNYLAETVSIDPTQGVVGEANTVNVSVVDENGDVSKVNGNLSATIVGQSDETADVDLKVNKQVKNGQARMYLESDKAGTVDVRVVVTANNGELYADTFTYTFGDKDEYTGTTVVMTIGSSEYVVNNKVITGDAEPFVDNAYRTMVPFRVLGETFGAEVDWDQDAQTVTYTYGDTVLTMTIGDDTYTVNGEEKTMDTAPVLTGDRTYVPVRFVAEALGYEVTPLYDVETGTTASVVFQK